MEDMGRESNGEEEENEGEDEREGEREYNFSLDLCFLLSSLHVCRFNDCFLEFSSYLRCLHDICFPPDSDKVSNRSPIDDRSRLRRDSQWE